MWKTNSPAVAVWVRWAFEKHTALAVATRMGPVAIARLSLAAYRQVAKDVRAMRPRPLDLGKPADRWRLRLVIYDAAHELVWPERRQPFAGLAKSAKMRKGNYIKAHKCASAVLQEAPHGGAGSGTRCGEQERLVNQCLRDR